MKKWLSLFLVCVMVMSMCACGKKKDEIVTLTWLVPGDKQADIASVMEEVNKITVEKIGAKIDLQFIDTGAFSQRMTMNMASGGDFDICFTGWVNKYTQAANKGGYMALDSLLAEHAPALKEAIPEYLWEGTRIKGEIYAVPNQQIMAQPMALYIPKAIAEKYDFDFSAVKKVSDIEPFLAMVKEGEPNKYPFRINLSTNMWYSDTYETVSAGYCLPTDGSSYELKDLYTTPEYQEGLNTLRDWYVKGYIRPDVASVGDDTSDYMGGKYVVTTGTTKPGDEQETFQQLGYEVIIIPITRSYLKTSNIHATMNAISRSCKNPEKAIKFLELLNTDKELYNLICHGIKDKHYTLNENNKVVYIENSGYTPNADWKFGNQFNSYVKEGSSDTVWEETKAMNENSLKSPLLGFSFDNTAVKNEISQLSAVGSKYSASENGSIDPDEYWDSYMNELNAAGREKVRAEYQRQINEWLKTK